MKGNRVKRVADPDEQSGRAIVPPSQQDVEAALTALIDSVLPRIRTAAKGRLSKGKVSKGTAPKGTAPKGTAPTRAGRKRPAR